jgi:hypothetical protein
MKNKSSPFQGVDEGHCLNGELILILILIYYLIECFIGNNIQLEETSFHTLIKCRTSLVIWLAKLISASKNFYPWATPNEAGPLIIFHL